VQGTHPKLGKLRFLSPEVFDTCIKRRFLFQGQNGAACLPITRAALYADDLLAVTAHHGL
jgi:hypothetical protein